MAIFALCSPCAVLMQATYSPFCMGRLNDSVPLNGCLAASVPSGLYSMNTPWQPRSACSVCPARARAGRASVGAVAWPMPDVQEVPSTSKAYSLVVCAFCVGVVRGTTSLTYRAFTALSRVTFLMLTLACPFLSTASSHHVFESPVTEMRSRSGAVSLTYIW